MTLPINSDKARNVLAALAKLYDARLQDEDGHWSLTNTDGNTLYVYHDGEDWQHDARYGAGSPKWGPCTLGDIDSFLACL